MQQNSSTLGQFPPPGTWLEKWISKDRFEPYLDHSHGDLAQAFQLYLWNAAASKELLHDTGFLEVALRNAYHRELSTLFPHHPGWVHQGAHLFPQRQHHNQASVFLNDKLSDDLRYALKKNRRQPPDKLPGKVVADLGFTFWVGLNSTIYNRTLWRPALHNAWPSGTSPKWLLAELQYLRNLRNRVAHHEQILGVNLTTVSQKIQQLVRMLVPETGQTLAAISRLVELQKTRP